MGTGKTGKHRLPIKVQRALSDDPPYWAIFPLSHSKGGREWGGLGAGLQASGGLALLFRLVQGCPAKRP